MEDRELLRGYSIYQLSFCWDVIEVLRQNPSGN